MTNPLESSSAQLARHRGRSRPPAAPGAQPPARRGHPRRGAGAGRGAGRRGVGDARGRAPRRRADQLHLPVLPVQGGTSSASSPSATWRACGCCCRTQVAATCWPASTARRRWPRPCTAWWTPTSRTTATSPTRWPCGPARRATRPARARSGRHPQHRRVPGAAAAAHPRRRDTAMACYALALLVSEVTGAAARLALALESPLREQLIARHKAHAGGHARGAQVPPKDRMSAATPTRLRPLQRRAGRRPPAGRLHRPRRAVRQPGRPARARRRPADPAGDEVDPLRRDPAPGARERPVFPGPDVLLAGRGRVARVAGLRRPAGGLSVGRAGGLARRRRAAARRPTHHADGGRCRAGASASRPSRRPRAWCCRWRSTSTCRPTSPACTSVCFRSPVDGVGDGAGAGRRDRAPRVAAARRPDGLREPDRRA